MNRPKTTPAFKVSLSSFLNSLNENRAINSAAIKNLQKRKIYTGVSSIAS
jgi:hypothetical protein